MKLPKIVGIAGTNGAGKDELGLLLGKLRNYHFVSASDILRDELRRSGTPLQREHLAALSQKWRVESGDEGILIVKAIEQFEKQNTEKKYDGLVIVSLRHPEEVKRIHQHGGVVVWVDADQRHRYDRLQRSGRGRPEDLKTFEQFQAEEDREMHPAADAAPGTLNMKAVHDLADVFIENNFSSIDEYHAYLRERFELNES